MKHCQNYDIKTEKLRFINELKESGHRITQQRIEIVEAIFKFNLPFSADELLKKTKSKKIDLTTIYRFLTSFSKLGLLGTVHLADGVTRYEYTPDKHHHHHHIVCTACKRIETIATCMIQKQENLIKKMGYRDISHRLEFFGLCQNCY